jgi:hypothetical protein
MGQGPALMQPPMPQASAAGASAAGAAGLPEVSAMHSEAEHALAFNPAEERAFEERLKQLKQDGQVLLQVSDF